MNRNATETIKQKLSIESVVGSYVKLEKSGKNFRACCPFHNEKTPSFYVTPDRGIYYCYGCHKGGDIFSFVQEIEGVAFIDALKLLADKAGVSLESTGEPQTKMALQREIMEQAARYYEVGLRTNVQAVTYLLERGLTKDTMVQFRIGYAPKGWSGLVDTLKRKKYSEQDILATGLALPGKQGGIYDRFRERIMFPITDPQGRVIAFTGRVLPGTEEASRPVGKYINSPETDLYHKSAVLFGFDKAKASIHTEDFVILVEGQMDCIMSHQAGVTNVVAISGTATTELHMKQIARFTRNVAICLDTDDAGLAAAQKTALCAVEADMRVLVIDVPGAKDPAESIQENPDQWKDWVSKRKDFITFRLHKMKERSGEHGKVALAEKELFPILAHIQSEIILDERLQEIAHAFLLTSSDPVRKEFEKFLKKYREKESGQMTSAKEVSISHGDPKITLQKYLAGISDHFDEEENIELEQAITYAKDEYLDYKKSRSDYQKQEDAFLIEQEHGSFEKELYRRLFLHGAIRYELMIIGEKRERLISEIGKDSNNKKLLEELHALQVRKDELTRSLY